MKRAWRKASVKPEALVRLFAQLGIAARAGLPIADALEILAQDRDGDAPSRATIAGIAERTRAGGSLSDALRQAGPFFTAETVALVRRAEETGSLAPVLQMLAQDLEHRARFRTATRAALSWPGAALGAFVIVFVAMAIFIVPAYESIFASMGAQLPGPTRVVLGASRVIKDAWFIWVPLLAIAIFLFVPGAARIQWERLETALEKAVMRTPFARTYVRRTINSRLTGILIAAADGAPLRESLAHLRATSFGTRTASPVAKLEARVAAGLVLGDAVAATPELPGRLRVAVMLGQRTDRLATALQQTLALAEEEAERSLVRLEQAALGLAYFLTGALVGFLVIAMYLPIFKMGSVV